MLNDNVPDNVPDHVPSSTSLPTSKSQPTRSTNKTPILPAQLSLPSSSPPGPSTQSPQSTRTPPSPQILIFSNSMCKRIDERRFYQGRTTKVFAQGGATITDVQRMVENCQFTNPKHVILQAWTNNVTRDSTETCDIKARSLINTTLQKFPSANIIISSILPRLIPTTSNSPANQKIRHLNNIFENNCRSSSRVTFANHIPSFVTSSGQILHQHYWDEVHLNKSGIGRLITNLKNAINYVSHPTRYPQQPKT